MRWNNLGTIHTTALYLAPILVAWWGVGVACAIGLAALMFVAGILTRFHGVSAPADPSLMELHTISYSHYVEKVRWCLDETGIEYQEVPSIGILGLLLTGRTVPLLTLPGSRVSIGDSPQILRFLWGAYSAQLAPQRCRFLQPSPEALALERRFDLELGVKVRQWSYWHLFQQRDLTLKMWGYNEPAIPSWQRMLLPALMPLLAAMVRRELKVDAVRAAQALQATRRVFAEVDEMLADGRRYLLGGDEKTFVDITFASLAALALFPDGYGGDAVSQKSLPLDQISPEWRTEVEALRATAAGQFVLRLYAEERKPRH